MQEGAHDKEASMTAQFRTILCPVDFSTASHHAFEYALKFARIYGSKIRLLHVVSPVMPEVYSSGASMANFTTEFQNQAMQQIERYRRRAERKNIPVVAEVKVGSVLPEIQRESLPGEPNWLLQARMAIADLSNGSLDPWSRS